MKSNLKTKTIISLTIGIALAFSAVITTNLNFFAGTNYTSMEYRDNSNLDSENLKLSKISGKIHVDNNWTLTKAAGICTGDGNYSTPYLIEDLIIDGGGLGVGIYIQSSNEYFRVENCTVYNSEEGINLSFANNGTILGNNLTYNNYGISIAGCKNSTISGNTVSNNTNGGIELFYGRNNTISGNTANYNGYQGDISLWETDDNIVSGNNVSGTIHLNNCSFHLISGNIVTKGGLGIEFCDNSTITENVVNDGGIGSSYGSNNTVIGNTVNNYIEAGISISDTDNNIVSGNFLLNNGGGIHIGNANYTRILNNTIKHSSGEGIIIGGNNNWISNNYVDNNTWGMGFGEGHNNTAIDNYIHNSSAIGIEVYSDNLTFLDNIITNNGNGIMITSSNNNISGNTISFNDESGIHLGPDSNNNTISGNTVNNNNYGIDIGDSEDNIVSGNTINDNTDSGMHVKNCSNIIISGNTAENNDEFGLYIEICQDIIITENEVNYNGWVGMWLGQFSDSIVTGNTVNHNADMGGIALGGSRNTISENTVSYNNYSGIHGGANSNIFYSNTANYNAEHGISFGGGYSIIEKNTANHNIQSGIYINGDYNNITENTANNNNEYGIMLDGGASNCTLYLNVLMGDLYSSATDEGTNNQWDNGTIGHLWEGYSGKDANDDGIGDSPYTVPGAAISQDNFPIWWDAPVFIISTPTPSEIFSELAPDFNMTLIEGIADTLWYSVDGGITNYTCSTSDTVNQTTWDDLGNGGITLTLYASDSRNYMALQEVMIYKDTITPVININAPLQNETFGVDAPSFDILITESNLEEKWYSLNGGTNVTFTTQTQISQAEWDALEEGPVIITFYARDAVGKVGMNSVIVIKDLPSTPGIPGYDLFFLIGILSVTAIVICKKVMKF